MKSYYVYILKCADDSYYTSITTNLSQRFREHHLGKRRNSYTYNRRPLQLAFCTKFDDLSLAVNSEIQIKNWSQSKKEALIKGEEILPRQLNFKSTEYLDNCRLESA